MQDHEVTPEPLMRMVNGAWVAKTLTVATELGLFTRLASGAATVQEVAEGIGIDRRPARMLLDACVALGLLGKAGGRYGNEPVADRFLVSGKASYFGDMIVMLGTREYDVWGRLKQAVETNSPCSPDIIGLTADPETARQFTRAMHNNAIAPAKALSTAVDLSPYRNLLDLGGGSGAFSIVLTSEFPNLSASIFDFPHVCEVAREFISALGADARVNTIAGNFWEDSLPEGFDVVLLSQVLHSFNEEKCRCLLSRVQQSLPPGGLVIINEFLMNEDRSGPLFPALFALNMLTASEDGNAYTAGEVESWLGELGFESAATQCLSGPVATTTARKKA